MEVSNDTILSPLWKRSQNSRYHKWFGNVAEMSGETLGYDIRAAKVVRPHEFAGKTYIGPVLISIGLITFIAAAFYNVFRSYSKNFLWKFKGTEFEL